MATIVRSIEESPLRVRDVVTIGHLAVALVASVCTAVIALGTILLPLAQWKGGVDEQLRYLHTTVEHIDLKLDRFDEPEKGKTP